MTRATLTTAQAAWLLGIPPGSLARWCREHGITPVRRQRIGRSTVTIWAIADLTRASAPASPVDNDQGCVVKS